LSLHIIMLYVLAVWPSSGMSSQNYIKESKIPKIVSASQAFLIKKYKNIKANILKWYYFIFVCIFLCTYAWWWLNSQTYCHNYVKRGFYNKYIVVFVSVCWLFSCENTTVWLYIRLKVFNCNNRFCWPLIVEGSTHAPRDTVHAFCYVVYCERLKSNQRTLKKFQMDIVIVDITLPPVASYICMSCWL